MAMIDAWVATSARGKLVRLRDRFFRELDKNRDAVEQLLEHARHGTVTLV
jgi:hypothetical protein